MHKYILLVHNRETNLNVMDKDNLFNFCSFEFIIINSLAGTTSYSESNDLTSAAHLCVYHLHQQVLTSFKMDQLVLKQVSGWECCHYIYIYHF